VADGYDAAQVQRVGSSERAKEIDGAPDVQICPWPPAPVFAEPPVLARVGVVTG